ncbi:MAG: tetratricopeptide repeat protein [Candidatus Obscuribacterales bacterium]|nr:tetratricopeptide repeat protein [Candidatus Obscuribacterales bacterium]
MSMAFAGAYEDEILKAEQAAVNADVGAARDHFLKAKTLDALAVEAQGGLAFYSFAAGGRKEDSAKLLDELVSKNPRSPEALMYRGMFYSETGKIDDSLNDLNAALKLKPNLTNALRYRAFVYEKKNQPLHAIDDFSSVLKMSSKTRLENGMDYFLRGRLFFSLNNIPAAIADFDAAEKLSVYVPELYKSRGMAKVDVKLYSEAEADLTKALEFDKSDVSALFSRSEALFQQRKFDKAIEDLSVAIKLSPLSPEIYAKRAHALRASGKLKEAVSDFEKVIELRGTASDYTNVGMVYALLGNNTEAIAAYDKSIAKDPKIAMTYNNRGTSLSALNQMDRALADYTRAIELDSAYSRKKAGGVGSEFAFANRARLYSRLNRHEEAIADISNVIACRPVVSDISSWFYFRASEYWKKGEPINAFQDFLRAAWLLPKWILVTLIVAPVALIAILFSARKFKRSPPGQQAIEVPVSSS